MGQLEECRQILLRHTAADGLTACTYRDIDTYRLTREHASQGGSIELSHAGFRDSTIEECEVGDVLIAIDRGASLSPHGHRDGIGSKVGLLDIHLHAIGQRPLYEAVLIVAFADDRGRLRVQR